MKSCRNCAHSRHDMARSAYNPELYCAQTKRTVAPPISRNTPDNIQTAAKLRAIAATCAAYSAEE